MRAKENCFFYQGYVMASITAAQVRAARATLKWGVRDLAKKAKVSPNTISRIENGADTLIGTMDAIQAALEKAGVEFIPANGGGPGVRLKSRE